MPMETRPEVKPSQRIPYTYLEAFGRLMTGMALWLELGKHNTAEGRMRVKCIELARQSLINAVNPASPNLSKTAAALCLIVQAELLLLHELSIKPLYI